MSKLIKTSVQVRTVTKSVIKMRHFQNYLQNYAKPIVNNDDCLVTYDWDDKDNVAENNKV